MNAKKCLPIVPRRRMQLSLSKRLMAPLIAQVREQENRALQGRTVHIKVPVNRRTTRLRSGKLPVLVVLLSIGASVAGAAPFVFFG